VRQSRELCDLDAVAAVRPAGDDLAQEDELVAALFDGNAVILHAGEHALKLGELVIVRGEERLRAKLFGVGAEFEHRAGNAHAVEGRRAAADLVENEQGARRCLMQDLAHLGHLDHEGGLAAGQVVARADAREDAVDNADARRTRGHEPICAMSVMSAT